MDQQPSPIPKPRRPVYSVSGLMTYTSCPLQYYYAFVLGYPPPRSPAMATGVSIHKLIADHLRGRLPLDRDLDPKLTEMIDHFRRSRFNLSPVATEKSFRLPLEQGDVRGRIDLVLPNPAGGLEIVDFKSGDRQDRASLRDRLQLPLYALAAGQLYGVQPGELAFTYYFVRHDAEERFDFSPEQAQQLESRVDAIMADIDAGRFQPAADCDCYACRRERRYPRRTGLVSSEVS